MKITNVRGDPTDIIGQDRTPLQREWGELLSVILFPHTYFPVLLLQNYMKYVLGTLIQKTLFKSKQCFRSNKITDDDQIKMGVTLPLDQASDIVNRQYISASVFRNKHTYLFDTLIQKKVVLDNEINNFWGDLTNISARTGALLYIPVSDFLSQHVA